MPFRTPGLSDLQAQVEQDMQSSPAGIAGLLRFSNLRILGKVQAALAYLHYDFLRWISRQAVPFTSEGEYLQGWGALKKVYIKPNAQATGVAVFPGCTPGVTLPAGSLISRSSDGLRYVTLADVVSSASGVLTVPASAVADPAGVSGASGNMPAGTPLSLVAAVPGIASSGTASTDFTGGADLESDDDFRGRVMSAFQVVPQGGAVADYEQWAKSIPGITRAWAVGNGFGVGTVVLYIMLDAANAGSGGFPVGSDGVSSLDAGPGGVPRGVVAKGDQLTVANAIVTQQPVTALLYVVSPVKIPVNFIITGIPVAAQSGVTGAISNVFLRNGRPGGKINLVDCWTSIASVSGVSSFVISSPSSDIQLPVGGLPVLGTLTFQ